MISSRDHSGLLIRTRSAMSSPSHPLCGDLLGRKDTFQVMIHSSLDKLAPRYLDRTGLSHADLMFSHGAFGELKDHSPLPASIPYTIRHTHVVNFCS